MNEGGPVEGSSEWSVECIQQVFHSTWHTVAFFQVWLDKMTRADLWRAADQEQGVTDLEKKVVVDWPNPQEACQQHHQAGSDQETTGKEKEGKT